jgi:signal peptidase II
VAILAAGSAAASRRVRLAMLTTVAVVLTADQVSKALILAARPAAGTGWITVRLLRNTGANGGIGAGYPLLVTLVAIAIACVAATAALRVRGRGIALCLAAVVGGALGNLSDRLFRAPGFGRGGVVDWIHLGLMSGSFNVADLAIQIGVLGTIIGLLAGERVHKAGQPTQNASAG